MLVANDAVTLQFVVTKMRYELSNIHPPRPYSKMVMRGIDNHRRIAGYSYNSQDDAIRAVLWSSDRLTDLGTLGGRNSFANAINDKGLIVGYSELRPGSSTYRAFRYEAGFIEDLGTLGGDHSTATAVNNSGVIVGEAQRGTGLLCAFIAHDGPMEPLEGFGEMRCTAYAVNAIGTVVGQAHLTNKVAHAVVWAGGELLDLGTLGGLNSAAMAVNDRGDVVGWSQVADGTVRAFIWRHRLMQELPCGEGVATAARAINNDGLIVGTANYPGRKDSAGICWVNDKIRNMHDGLQHAHGWTIKSPKAINQRGDIIGEAMVGGLTQSFFMRRSDKKSTELESVEKVIPDFG